MTVDRDPVLDRILSLELARVTERAAIAAARFAGRGDESQADNAAIAAMQAELDRLPIDGAIVLGEGEPDDGGSLRAGARVGIGGAQVDIALDPLEGATICAKNLPNALAAIAVSRRGSLLPVPDIYMEKIAVGAGYPDGVIDLDASPAENIARVAEARGVQPDRIVACILDRPRHARLIEAVRSTGAAIRLIGDGDLAAIMHVADPDRSGVDLYLGSGGAREGILGAALLRCAGGQMQGRLIVDSADKMRKLAQRGIEDGRRILSLADMAGGDIIFAATGVTDGPTLGGVKFRGDRIETHTVVLRSSSGTVRTILSRHRDGERID